MVATVFSVSYGLNLCTALQIFIFIWSWLYNKYRLIICTLRTKWINIICTNQHTTSTKSSCYFHKWSYHLRKSQIFYLLLRHLFKEKTPLLNTCYDACVLRAFTSLSSSASTWCMETRTLEQKPTAPRVRVLTVCLPSKAADFHVKEVTVFVFWIARRWQWTFQKVSISRRQTSFLNPLSNNAQALIYWMLLRYTKEECF